MAHENDSVAADGAPLAGWFAGSALGEASARQWYVLIVL